jgi:hypothetical protein
VAELLIITTTPPIRRSLDRNYVGALDAATLTPQTPADAEYRRLAQRLWRRFLA